MNKRNFLKTGLLGMVAFLVPGKIKALEFYPKPSQKKWAVLYGTWCGSSRDAGVWISEGMNGIANVFDVRENPDLSGYDYLIIGGSIRMGKVPPELAKFIEDHKETLKNKIKALFAVCGNRMQTPGQQQKTDLIDNHLAKLCGVENIPSHIFLGRVTYGLMDDNSAKMLKGMDMPEYDNLKRQECMDFGKEILAAIP